MLVNPVLGLVTTRSIADGFDSATSLLVCSTVFVSLDEGLVNMVLSLLTNELGLDTAVEISNDGLAVATLFLSSLLPCAFFLVVTCAVVVGLICLSSMKRSASLVNETDVDVDSVIDDTENLVLETILSVRVL